MSETTCMVPHFGHSIELRAEGIVVLCSERTLSIAALYASLWYRGLKSEVTAFEACYKVDGSSARPILQADRPQVGRLNTLTARGTLG